ncbi:MAG: hypothetical protein XE11_0410 [Methanomicrobiales archaeon 53_19]|nr:MAG: hypothetical protein XD88_1340 [Methanocalculus sp. 52_23]KUL04630.1 MAG: hypothetical protein XE11_0410 [Methanomicrobiales archaeon 53_19]HIJ06851.1 hypothetical protein [Methanocalculus sp.]
MIGFILIIAILMIFLSLWMVYVVPAEGRQQEIEHMNYVRTWFTQYKVTADSLWVNHEPNDPYKSLTGVTFSNSLTLGSQGGATQAGGLFLPVMSPIGSTGAIAVANQPAASGGVERIEISKDGAPAVIEFEMGRLEYDATNHYWIPQSYYYQMGGVFLKQSSGTVARVSPLINFETGGTFIALVELAGAGQVGLSGQGPVRIDTKMTNRTQSYSLIPAPATPYSNITIYLEDANVARGWENALKELRFQSGVSSGACTIYRNPTDVVRIDLQGGPEEIQYRYIYYTISVQSIATGAT